MYEFFIATRYLKSKRRKKFVSIITLISVGGVALGVMALIIVLSVMGGFEKDLREKILAAKPHILIQKKDESPIEGYQKYIENLKRIKDVSSVSPVIRGQALLTSDFGALGAEIAGIDLTDKKHYGRLIRSIKAVDNSLLKKSSIENKMQGQGKRYIILGKELSSALNVSPGGRVKMISPIGKATPVGMIPIIREFIVAATFETGIYENDSSLAYISLRDGDDFFQMKGGVSGIEMRVNDIFGAGGIALEARKLSGDFFEIRDWMEMNRHLFSALKLEKVAMFAILLLIIIVAVFNIASTLIMIVMEKGKEIAILRSMGAAKKEIMRIFMIEGVITGLVGTTIGVFAGVLISLLLAKYQFVKLDESVFYITNIPVSMDFTTIALIAVSSVILSFLSTLYPSWYASKLDPVEALRYE